jgi:hypothetical protein
MANAAPTADDFEHLVEFGTADHKTKEAYSNRYTLSGVYLPGQFMWVRWWPKNHAKARRSDRRVPYSTDGGDDTHQMHLQHPHFAPHGSLMLLALKRCCQIRPHHYGERPRRKRLLHSIIRVSAKAAAWMQHTSCTHPIAGCRDRSRSVGRQRYSGRCLYQGLYHPRGCQSVSWSRSHWCSKTKAMPDRQRQGFFSRVPKKLSKQVSHGCAIITPSATQGTAHRMDHSCSAQSGSAVVAYWRDVLIGTPSTLGALNCHCGV